MLKFIFSIFLFFGVFTLEASTFSQERSWFGLFGKKEFTEKNFIHSETQLRYDLNSPTMQQTLFRFGVLHQINANHEIGLLAGYIQLGLLKEYRPTLQYTYFSDSFDSYSFSLRNRLETRFMEEQSETSIRYRLAMRGQKKVSDQLTLVVWDEPFINFTKEDWTGERTMERNRLFIGPRISWEKLNFEVGYMNQYIPRKNRNVMEHVLVGYIFF